MSAVHDQMQQEQERDMNRARCQRQSLVEHGVFVAERVARGMATAADAHIINRIVADYARNIDNMGPINE
jgi:hypothetical protein